MKNMFFIPIIIFGLLLITGCTKVYSDDITFVNSFKQDTMTGITYKFIGKSEHFGFETGKVYYTDTDREILITNFKQIKEINKIDKFTINVYFNDIYWGGSDWLKEDTRDFEDYLRKNTLAETGRICDISSPCESDSFIRTAKNTFEDAIKIEAKYCYKDNCKTETMNLTYIEE
jgi:hypothetical protein